MRNYLIFGGVNSASYGIYITGSGVYNAPGRAVERVTVPGRNGLLLIDQGRYENISVEYPAFAYGKSRKEFSEKIEAFRNAIVSLIGYQRLEDSYHPNEYKMGLYAEGFDVDVGAYGGSGKFTLKFSCKPQRFLKSGEIPVTVANGETLINPTQHDAHPLLKVEGYGTIGFNGHSIKIDDARLGKVLMANSRNYSTTVGSLERTIELDTAALSSGNSFSLTFNRVNTLVANLAFRVTGITLDSEFRPIDPTTGTALDGRTDYAIANDGSDVITQQSGMTIPYNYGTAYLMTWESNFTVTYQNRVTVYPTPVTTSVTISTVINYDGADLITIRTSITYDTGVFSGIMGDGNNGHSMLFTTGDIYGNSTVRILGHPTYIDCDLGEVYKYEGDSLISLNAYVALGSDLPCLGTGSNEITADSTITAIELIPRWWII